MWEKIKTKAGEWAKAIVALAIPIILAAAAEFVDEISDLVADSGTMWSGVAVGLLTSVGVWLKANRPS